jgi:hypothetical protein
MSDLRHLGRDPICVSTKLAAGQNAGTTFMLPEMFQYEVETL